MVFCSRCGAGIVGTRVAGLVGAGIATSVAYFLDFLAKLLVYVRLTGNKWVLVVFVIKDDVRLLKSSMAARVK